MVEEDGKEGVRKQSDVTRMGDRHNRPGNKEKLGFGRRYE